MHTEHDRSLASLRLALDHIVGEAAAEILEHERHVADAKRRHQHLRNLRAALDKPPATGPRR